MFLIENIISFLATASYFFSACILGMCAGIYILAIYYGIAELLYCLKRFCLRKKSASDFFDNSELSNFKYGNFFFYTFMFLGVSLLYFSIGNLVLWKSIPDFFLTCFLYSTSASIVFFGLGLYLHEIDRKRRDLGL